MREKAEVADSREAPRQNVLQEAAQELFVRKSHHPALAVVLVVFPPELNLGVGDVEEAMIGDRHAMRIAGQVMQHMFRSAERPLGINHPFIAKQGSRERGELLRLGETFTTAKESKLVFAE